MNNAQMAEEWMEISGKEFDKWFADNPVHTDDTHADFKEVLIETAKVSYQVGAGMMMKKLTESGLLIPGTTIEDVTKAITEKEICLKD